jgi:hypothetical protein
MGDTVQKTCVDLPSIHVDHPRVADHHFTREISIGIILLHQFLW